MKKNLTPVLALLIGLWLLPGCAGHYVVTLNNGAQIGAQGKPELRGNAYYFKDANGKETSVAAGRVTQIETESSAQRSQKSGFRSSGK